MLEVPNEEKLSEYELKEVLDVPNEERLDKLLDSELDSAQVRRVIIGLGAVIF